RQVVGVAYGTFQGIAQAESSSRCLGRSYGGFISRCLGRSRIGQVRLLDVVCAGSATSPNSLEGLSCLLSGCNQFGLTGCSQALKGLLKAQGTGDYGLLGVL